MRISVRGQKETPKYPGRYFHGVPKGPVAGLILSAMTLWANARDPAARAFENGIVLANPSLEPFTFELSRMYPKQAFRRIQGVHRQSRKINTGKPAQNRVTLPPQDGLFLERIQ